MRFIELTEEKKGEAQAFVQANAAFLQDWDWGDFQKSRGKHVVRYALVEEPVGNGNKEEIVFFGQGIKERIGSRSYIFFPYGPAAKQSGDYNKKLRYFAQELKKADKDIVFLRIEPQGWLQLPYRDIVPSVNLNPHKTLILNIRRGDDEILAGMHHKTRYNIKVAQRHGVEIKVLDKLPGKDNIFLQTVNRAGIRGFPDDYYEHMVRYFATGKNIGARMYCAMHEGDLLAANIMLWWNKTAVYLFGGSTENKRNMMAPYLLHWQAMQDARAAGMEKYDFWGIETDPEHPWHGFSRFKLGFGGEISEYCGTHDFIYKRAWYNVYTILRKVNRAIKK